MSLSWRFGHFELSADRRQLLGDGVPAMLGSRAFDLLQVLIERRDRTVPKSELLDLVWPGLVVEENNLQVQVSTLRKLLGPGVITTVPGRGYRFTAALTDLDVDEPGHPDSVRSDATNGAASIVTPPTNLPRHLPPLYGRGAELKELRELAEAQKLVTVVGAGGIGKSRLAQAAARSLVQRWLDGAWMIELAGLSDPSLVPKAVAQVLDITMEPGSAVKALVAQLAARSMLLVLDNCEHLLDPVAALVQAILRDAPDVTVLCTSQEPLHLEGEQQYRLGPLAVPCDATGNAREYGAVTLFDARVRAVDPSFALDDTSLALAIDICRRLDGLPLAIELAAARVSGLGLHSIRDKLDTRFKLLSAGAPRMALPRHQTLRAALEWSHNLLHDGERTVFRRLGVFAGGFTAELAQAVGADEQLDEWTVLDHLGSLVDKSLVMVDAGGAPRYRLLESARAFALEQLSAHEKAELAGRHALAMRDFLVGIDGANLDGELRTDQYAALVLPELDNLRAAHDWATGKGGDTQAAITLAAHAGSLIDYAVECADWLLQVLQHVEAGEAADEAVSARYWRAIAAINMSGRVPRVVQREAANSAQSLYRLLGQPRRLFSSLIQLARQLRVLGDDVAAETCLDEARTLVQPDWPIALHIVLLGADSRMAASKGRLAEALVARHEAVRLSVPAGDWRLEVIQRNDLVDLLWQAGPIEEAARAVCKLADDLRAKSAGPDDMAAVLANAMGILCQSGRSDEAVNAACEALPNMRRSHRCYLEFWVYLFWRSGQVGRATQLLGAYEAELLRTGEQPQVNEARLLVEARAALQAVQRPEAVARGLAIGAALREAELFALMSDGLAAIANSPDRLEIHTHR